MTSKDKLIEFLNYKNMKIENCCNIKYINTEDLEEIENLYDSTCDEIWSFLYRNKIKLEELERLVLKGVLK